MSQISLLRERRFYPLFWTQFLGAFNDNFLKNAFVILITFRATDILGVSSAQMVVLAGGIFILPFFLFSATAGQLADRYEKGRLVRIIKLTEIGIMLLAAAGFLSERSEILLFALFLMGLHSTFFGPIKYSILPQHLEERELLGANALVEAGTFLAILLGTIAGGVLIALEPAGPIVVTGGLLFVAIAGYLTSRGIPLAPAVAPDLRVQWNPLPPTLEILRFARRDRSVSAAILGISWFWFFGAAFLSLFPHYCKEVLHAQSGVITLFLAAFSIGIGVGSLLCGRLSRERLELGWVPVGSVGMSLFALDLFFCGQPEFSRLAASNTVGVEEFLQQWQGIRILGDLLGLAVFSGLFTVPLYTLMQERAEPTHRSRVIAANNIVNALWIVLSALLIVVLNALDFTIPQLFLALAILNALVASYLFTQWPEFLARFRAGIPK